MDYNTDNKTDWRLACYENDRKNRISLLAKELERTTDNQSSFRRKALRKVNAL